MDCRTVEEQEVIIDIDNFSETSKEVETPLSEEKVGDVVSFALCVVPASVDDMVKGDNSGNFSSNQKTGDETSPGSGKNSKRERKLTSGKKPPKPPRPPSGSLLDAADQKLIKEISELAMIKRARIERMKALKKLKAAKASSTPSSSSGSLIALVFTIIFFIVIILQGCHSSEVSPGNKSSSRVTVQDQMNLITSVESPNAMEVLPGSDSKGVAEKAIH